MRTGELLARCFEQGLISGLHAAELHAAELVLPSGPVEPKPKARPRDAALSQQNARWNRIFEEKFADPSYYSTTRVRMQSPLAGF